MLRNVVHVLLGTALLAHHLPAGAVSQDPASGSPRIVAVGDIHGSIEGFTQILRAAGLIDGSGHWIGGTDILVQTGDYLDRGSDVRDVLDMLMRLQDEAKAARGRVEVLLGNHEAMNMLHDLRDVSPQAYGAFADGKSEDRRRRAYRDYEALMKRRGAGSALPDQEPWMAAHPPGFLEYVEAMGPRGRYGRWLRSRKVVVKEAGSVFMHAGIPPGWTGTLQDVNNAAARDLRQWDQAREMLIAAGIILPFFDLPETLNATAAEARRITTALARGEHPGGHVTQEYADALVQVTEIGRSTLLDVEGPLWFRGYALWADGEAPAVTELLQRFDASRFVCAHTPMPGRILARFDNRIFLIDTGMLTSVYQGRPAALELSNGQISAIYPDSREILVAPPAAPPGRWEDLTSSFASDAR